MNEREIRQGLEAGRQHPFPLLQHLAREGDQEGARLVAKIGPEYLQGRERLRFRGLVRELTPEVSEAEEAQRARRSEIKRQEHTSALAASLETKNAATRERRKGFQPPSGGGWNLPLDVKGK
jgi:hypothetical protein